MWFPLRFDVLRIARHVPEQLNSTNKQGLCRVTADVIHVDREGEDKYLAALQCMSMHK